MLVDPPLPADAEIFAKSLESGQNRPVILFARTKKGAVEECVVKLAARLGDPPREYLCEWIATAIGRALGIDVPAPFCVSVSKDFASSVSDADVRRDVLRSCVPSFGCKFERGAPQWASTPLRSEQRLPASELLAFDLFIHNIDRVRDNANLLMTRDRFVAIDHDLAFSFMLPPPLDDPGTTPRLDIAEKHVFAGELRGKMRELQEFRDSLTQLTDGWFRDLRDATPPEWTGGAATGWLDRIVDVIRRRRDHVEAWLGAVQAWME
jgi:hypothetical protein